MNNLKLSVIALAFIYPILIIYFFGADYKSFSDLWNTKGEALFIIVNASTSCLFFDLKRWKICSVFIMLLTAFSTVQYETIHNIFAILFFISVGYGLLEYNRYRYYFYIFFVGCLIGGLISLLWLEIFVIYTLCLYHLTILKEKIKFERR